MKNTKPRSKNLQSYQQTTVIHKSKKNYTRKEKHKRGKDMKDK